MKKNKKSLHLIETFNFDNKKINNLTREQLLDILDCTGVPFKIYKKYNNMFGISGCSGYKWYIKIKGVSKVVSPSLYLALNATIHKILSSNNYSLINSLSLYLPKIKG
jgi:hypothetical protein